MSASNTPLSSVRRILKELSELNTEISSDYKIHLVEDQLFELHFTIRGPPDTPYAKGRYHGKLILPHDYPFRPPEIVFLTPSGRFEVNKKICLSVTNYHPESWQPAWGIRTFMIGISSFMSVESADAIGSMHWTTEERNEAAIRSNSWVCPDCNEPNSTLLPDVSTTNSSSVAATSSEPPLHFDYTDEVEKKKSSATAFSSSATPTSVASAPTVSAEVATPPPPTLADPPMRIQRAYLDILIVCLLILLLSLLLRRES